MMLADKHEKAAPTFRQTRPTKEERRPRSTKAVPSLAILAQTPAGYIVLNDGYRIIAGLGFPPRRSMRRQQVIQSAGFALSFFGIAAAILFTGV